MTRATTKADSSLPQNDTEGHLFDNWIDPLEAVIRGRIRGFIEELIHEELDAALARPRYGRHAKNSKESADIAAVAGAAGRQSGNPICIGIGVNSCSLSQKFIGQYHRK